MELRSLLPLIDDPDWRSAVPQAGGDHPEYLVIVTRSDPKLFSASAGGSSANLATSPPGPARHRRNALRRPGPAWTGGAWRTPARISSSRYRRAASSVTARA